MVGTQGMSFRRHLYECLWAAQVKPSLERVPVLRRIYGGWTRTHPFDRHHGIDTSGFAPASECASVDVPAAQINFYGGSQPSIVRAVLATLPEPEHYAFVDIGCGKGRPMVVASEFRFQRLIGVELAPQLAQVARTNAATIAARHPDRTPIEILVGDATMVAPPADRVVYYLYNPFSRPLLKALVENVERQLQGRLQHAFFVCYNPVHGDVLDESLHFARWSANTIRYADDELGYGPDIEDTAVIWQSLPECYLPNPAAERKISVSRSQWCSLV
jgi:SAM-dependent methyltransferase